MTSTNIVFFFIFLVATYAIIIDKNVADLINLFPKIIFINLQRCIMMVRLHPKNPITNIIMRYKYNKIAKQLHEELNSDADE